MLHKLKSLFVAHTAEKEIWSAGSYGGLGTEADQFWLSQNWDFIFKLVQAPVEDVESAHLLFYHTACTLEFFFLWMQGKVEV